MALFKIEKGTAANLVTNRPNAVEGYAYFTTDDGKFYIDVSGGTSESPVSAIVGTNRIPLSADRADRIPYAENNEGSLIYNKTITTSDPFTLKDGNLIVIKFTADTPGGTTSPDNIITFNVNNTGAKHVYYRGARIPNDHLVSNKIYLFKVTSFQAYTEDDPPLQFTDYRYEIVGDVIPDLNGHETVITDNYGRLTTRPFMDSFQIVQTLPSEMAIDENVVYLVPTGESGTGGGSSSGGGSALTYTLSRNNKNIVLTASNNTSSNVEALNETQVQALIDTTITTALSTAYPTV